MRYDALHSWNGRTLPVPDDEQRTERQAQAALALLAALMGGILVFAERGDVIALLPWLLLVFAPLVPVWLHTHPRHGDDEANGPASPQD